MATAGQIAELREYIAEETDESGWTDDRIGAFIDRSDNVLLAAAAVWSAKAARYAGLVNVSESGSSRSLGSLIDNALKMADQYKAQGKAAADAETAELGSSITITKLTRS